MIKNQRNLQNNRGFTLIELMIVIAIIAIVAVLGITNFSAAIKKSRDSVRKSDISAISQALVLYRSDEGSYPGAGGLNSLTTTYIREIPHDPTLSGSWQDYSYYSGGGKFTICTRLEMPSGNYTGTNLPATNGRCPTTNTGNCAAGSGGTGSRSSDNSGCCHCVFSP